MIKYKRITIYVFGHLIIFTLRICRVFKKEYKNATNGNEDREILKNNQFIIKSKFKNQ